MKLRLHYSIILLFTFFTSFSQVQTINTVGTNFDPDTVTINLGDTIEFGPLSYHNAVEVNESTWTANDTAYNGGFYFELGSAGGYFIADSAKTYYYICQPHVSMGMKGVIIVNSYGCTDSLACNYDPGATVDDGSCAYPTDSTDVITDCDSYTWAINGTTYYSSTSDTVVGANAAGCLETNILHLTINYSTLDSVIVVACDSFTWSANGMTYYSSISDTVIGVNAAGCLETNILDLTINVGGCMDSMAINYNPLATCDDGSCELPPAENLFFSEYAEGSSNNKYFEVYNPTSDTVDLTNYAFARVSNAPTTVGVYEYWVDFDSAAVILPNDVYVVVHQSSDPFIIAEADMDYGSLSNGDDGFALVYGNNPGTPMSPAAGGYQILDWIGDWNGDPGQGWDVAGVNDATRDHTLVRKCPISQGDTSWTNAAGTDPINS